MPQKVLVRSPKPIPASQHPHWCGPHGSQPHNLSGCKNQQPTLMTSGPGPCAKPCPIPLEVVAVFMPSDSRKESLSQAHVPRSRRKRRTGALSHPEHSLSLWLRASWGSLRASGVGKEKPACPADPWNEGQGGDGGPTTLLAWAGRARLEDTGSWTGGTHLPYTAQSLRSSGNPGHPAEGYPTSGP